MARRRREPDSRPRHGRNGTANRPASQGWRGKRRQLHTYEANLSSRKAGHARSGHCPLRHCAPSFRATGDPETIERSAHAETAMCRTSRTCSTR